MRTIVCVVLLVAGFGVLWAMGFLKCTWRGTEVRVPILGHYIFRWKAWAWGVGLVGFLLVFPLQRVRQPGRCWRLLPSAALITCIALAAAGHWLNWPTIIMAAALACPVFWLLRRELARGTDWALALPDRRIAWGCVLWAVGFAAYFLLNRVMHGGEVYMGDSQARLFHAHILAKGMWALPMPEHPELYSEAWVVMWDGRWFSQYLPGAILLNLLGLKIGSIPVVFASLAGGCVALTWWIGRRLYNARVGLLGALLLMLSPMFALQASCFMDHMPTTFFLLAALAAGLRNLDAPTRRNAIALGLMVGYACITRPLTALGCAGPLLLVWWCLGSRQWRSRWVGWAVALGAWAAPMAFLLLFNAKTTGDPFLIGYRLADPQLHSLSFTEANDFTPFIGLIHQINNIGSLSFWLFMWPASAYLFLLLLALSGRAHRTDLLVFLPFPGLVACYFFYPYQDFYYSPRFLTESLPMLALLTARGILTAADMVNASYAEAIRPHTRRVLAAMLVGLTLLAVSPATSWFCRFNRDSQRGRRLTNTFRLFRDDPLATVFFDARMHLTRALVENAICHGGAEFLLDPGEEARRAYMAEHPERHFTLLERDDGDILPWRQTPLSLDDP